METTVDSSRFQAIIDHVARFTVPIGLECHDGARELRGTGTILTLGGKPYLLTCDHVARAGVYAYGRRQVEEILDEKQQPAKRQRVAPREKWHAYIEDHHPGYISHEAFERNQRRIAENCPRAMNVGSARESVRSKCSRSEPV